MLIFSCMPDIAEVPATIPNSKTPIRRIPTGIPGFDELIEGGLEEKTNTLLQGYAGTGKTTFSLQFLYQGAVQFNEPGVYLSFAESKDSIFRHALNFGWDFYALEQQGLVRHLFYKAHQVNKLLEEGGGAVRDAIQEIGAKRLVIDSITAYGLLFRDEYKQREALLVFFDFLVKWGCTSLIIAEEISTEKEGTAGEIGFLTDGIVLFYYSKVEDENGNIHRKHKLEVLKMRGTNHYNGVMDMHFSKNGVSVAHPKDLLSG